jgi:hypothetical protein
VRACANCGLSIGDSATFCQVCGTRCEAAAVVAGTAPDPPPVAARGPVLVDAPESAPVAASGEASAARLQAELVVAPESRPQVARGSVFDTAETDPSPMKLVADLGGAPAADPETASDVLGGDGVPAGTARRDAEPAQLAASGVTSAPGHEALGDAEDQRIAEVSDMLEAAAACEDTDSGRAATLYSDAVVACLEVTEDPLGSEVVRGELLRGFDRLSYLLAQDGLWTEALAVVEDAASLGLLDGGNGVHAGTRVALRDRREDLRRILHGNWARV